MMGALLAGGFFDSLLTYLTQLVHDGYLEQEHLDSLIVAADPRELLSRMQSYVPPGIPRPAI